MRIDYIGVNGSIYHIGLELLFSGIRLFTRFFRKIYSAEYTLSSKVDGI